MTACAQAPLWCITRANLTLSVHRDFAAQVAIEMPFDIKTIESPTHKIKMKVCRMGVTKSRIRDGADVQFCLLYVFLLFVCCLFALAYCHQSRG